MRFHVILMLSWFWLEVNGDTCPAIYLRYAKQHTFCLPPKSSCTFCGIQSRRAIKKSFLESIIFLEAKSQLGRRQHTLCLRHQICCKWFGMMNLRQWHKSMQTSAQSSTTAKAVEESKILASDRTCSRESHPLNLHNLHGLKQ
uniref:U30-Theraphotoxin-Ct1h_1 n=1 Tax=Coremiocnemis tropix TaxID=1904443 RepID=A0A482Z7S0_CORTR